MVSINQKTEKKKQSAIVGGRCGVLVQVGSLGGRIDWNFEVKTNLKEARAAAADYAARGIPSAVCRRTNTNYKNWNFVSIDYRPIERLIPSKIKIGRYETLTAGGWVVCTFNADGSSGNVARWAAVLDDCGERSNCLDALALVMYNGRAVWC